MNVSRRRYMGAKGGSIPYHRIEYLETDGYCNVNPEVYGNARILGKAVRNSSTSTASEVLVVSTPQGRAGTFYGKPASIYNWGIGNTDGTYVNIPSTTLAEFDMEFYSNGVYGNINGQTVSRTTNYANTDWRVFSTSSGQYRFSGKLYWLKFYQDGILVRDLVPCRISSVGYLYDRVSGELFGNLGTGNFVLGPDINE